MNILVVPDKFKGTLTAHDAAKLIAQGWREARPGDNLELLPMSDGGDGFGEVLASLLSAEVQTTPTLDAAHRPLTAKWWRVAAEPTAIIESAQIIGLAQLPPKQFHPFDLDTFGLGAVFEQALSSGARRLVIGIGGSATNDGGFGAACALGWKFFNAHAQPILRWTDLKVLHALHPPPEKPFRAAEILVAVDVQNPLLGPVGASRVYGPQKGLRPEDFPLAEACLGRLAEISERELGLPGAAKEPGTGAAGGLGFGLRCFQGARLESGFELFARHARLEERIRAANLVITGEGALDGSTLMGKGVGEVAALCRRAGVPCLGLAGTLNAARPETEKAGFAHAYGLVPQLTSPDQAKANPQLWLPRLAALAAREWFKETVSENRTILE